METACKLPTNNFFFAIKKCLECALLPWDKMKRGKIEMCLFNLKFPEAKIFVTFDDNLLIEFDKDSFAEDYKVKLFIEVLQLLPNDSNEKSKIQFHFSSLLQLDNFSYLIEKIKSYLSFLCFMFKSIYEVVFYLESENSRQEIKFEIFQNEGFLSINNKVTEYCTENTKAATIQAATTFALKKPLSNNLSEMKVNISLFSTSHINFKPIFGFYIFGPYGFPIFNNNLPSTYFETLVDWSDYGIFLREASFNTKDKLLDPYCLKEIKFQKNVESCNLLMLLKINSIDVKLLAEKVEILHYCQFNIEELLLHNRQKVSQALKEVLRQALKKGKLALQEHIRETTATNTATSIFDIVAYSTNTVFRETCLSLMGSATTQGLKSDLHDAIKKLCDEKIEAKRRKRTREQEDSEWDFLQNTSSSF